MYIPSGSSTNEIIPLPSLTRSLAETHALDLESGHDPFDHADMSDHRHSRHSVLSDFVEKRTDLNMSTLNSSTSTARRTDVGRRWYQRVS